MEIDLFYVLVGLFIGLFFVYSSCPKPELIIKE